LINPKYDTMQTTRCVYPCQFMGRNDKKVMVTAQVHSNDRLPAKYPAAPTIVPRIPLGGEKLPRQTNYYQAAKQHKPQLKLPVVVRYMFYAHLK